MDPLSCLGAGAAILQFIDFGLKLVSKGFKLHQSVQGQLVEHSDLAAAARNIIALHDQILTSVPEPQQYRQPSDAEHALIKCRRECHTVAKELVEKLETLRVRGKRTKWNSLRAALKSVSNKATVDRLHLKLESSRQQLTTSLLLLTLQELRRPEWQQRHLDMPRRWESRLIKNVDGDEDLKHRALDKIGKRDVGLFNVYLSRYVAEQSQRTIEKVLIEQLSHTDLRDREQRIPCAHSETFEWVFERGNSVPANGYPWSSLVEWLEGDQNVYWITGKAGSGKSTLMKYICNDQRSMAHLRQWARDSRLICARFYIWNSGSALQMSMEGLLRSVLHDALKQNPSLTKVVFPTRWQRCLTLGGDMTTWTLSELKSAFQLLCSKASPTLKLSLFIDGLDEFDNDHINLVEMLQSTLRSPYIKACLASRPWPVFQDAFGLESSLMLQHLTRQDILKYATDKLSSHRIYRDMQLQQPQYATRLIDTIAMRSEGVFLWVTLVVRSLMTGLSNRDRISDLQRRLDKLPSDLEKLYLGMFESIEPFYRNHACHLLELARVSEGSLTALALSFADEEDDEDTVSARPLVPIRNDEKWSRLDSIDRRLQGCCKGFLEITTVEAERPLLKPPRTRRQGLGSDPETMMANLELDDATTMYANSTFATSDDTAAASSQNEPTVTMKPKHNDGKVTYIHRTARDFLNSDSIAAAISDHCSTGFLPHLCLLKGYILTLKTSHHDFYAPTWNTLYLCMGHAGGLEGRPEAFARLCKLLDVLDDTMSQLLHRPGSPDMTTKKGAGPSHWTTERPGRHTETGFLAFVSEYRLQSYVSHKIKGGSQIFEVEKKYPLLYYAAVAFADYKALCDTSPEYGGVSVPSHAIVQGILNAGADPNEVLAGTRDTVWTSVLKAVVEIPQRTDLSEESMTIILKAWVPVIKELIRHGADPRANRNSPVASCIREAFGYILPEEAAQLERALKHSQRKRSALGIFFVPPSKPVPPPRPEELLPLSVHNRREAMALTSTSFIDWFARGRTSKPRRAGETRQARKRRLKEYHVHRVDKEEEGEEESPSGSSSEQSFDRDIYRRKEDRNGPPPPFGGPGRGVAEGAAG